MCDCENMTTSVRDEKIALVFETVFEEQASDEGEVTAVLWPKNFSGMHGNMMFTYFRSNGINFRRCWPSWEDELGRKGS